MNSRTFGRTGVPVSEIGFGTWAMGGMWGPRDDKLAKEALNLSLDLGVNFFDTAYVYGDGHSEQLIGEVVNERKVREKVFIATKVPPKDYHWPARTGSDVRSTFPASWIRSITEKSLRNLGVDCVDLQQLHVWASCWFQQGDWLEELQKLRKEGKVRWFGISINDHEPDTALGLVASGLVDSVQVIYNIFEQTPERALFPACQAHGVAVIARVPFDEGSLTGAFTRETVFHPDDWRARYFGGDRLRETVERVDRLKPLVGGDTKSLAQAALKFCLAHPAVSTVIPGMRRIAHVEDNVAASGSPLSAEQLRQLRAHAWPRNFYRGVW